MKVMTLNLNFYADKHGPWGERKKLICDAIRRERPDIAAFQACRKNSRAKGSKTQVEEIVKEVPGYRDILFQGFMEHEDGVDGQAFISKLPIREIRFERLTRHPDNQEDLYERFIYHVSFDTEKGPFHIYNSHFSWVDVQNEANIREAMKFIRPVTTERPSSANVPDLKEIRPTNEAALILGDFNATPDKPALKILEKEGWTDLWTKLQKDDPGYTFESQSPSMRIDYIWANPAAAALAKSINVVSAETEDKKARLSDHRGLYAAF